MIANQPGLRTAIIGRLRADRPPRSGQRGRGHGRTEERFIEVTPATGMDFPGATQVFRITRYTVGLDGQRARKEVVHGNTNLTATQADAGRLAALIRGHWAIENSIHWVRDMTFGEDAHRARTGNAPAVLACIRNLVTTALRLAGALNIAAARRAAALNLIHVLRLLRRPAKPGQTFAMTEPSGYGPVIRPVGRTRSGGRRDAAAAATTAERPPMGEPLTAPGGRYGDRGGAHRGHGQPSRLGRHRQNTRVHDRAGEPARSVG